MNKHELFFEGSNLRNFNAKKNEKITLTLAGHGQSVVVRFIVRLPNNTGIIVFFEGKNMKLIWSEITKITKTVKFKS
ncbi:MAG: hypothetical protein L3J07_00025 [Candidatus Magasanikbacteria bacterium]|nr:hypothetical protein [Candidatus Magasanikbacteria bacterium]